MGTFGAPLWILKMALPVKRFVKYSSRPGRFGGIEFDLCLTYPHQQMGRTWYGS